MCNRLALWCVVSVTGSLSACGSVVVPLFDGSADASVVDAALVDARVEDVRTDSLRLDGSIELDARSSSDSASSDAGSDVANEDAASRDAGVDVSAPPARDATVDATTDLVDSSVAVDVRPDAAAPVLGSSCDAGSFLPQCVDSLTLTGCLEGFVERLPCGVSCASDACVDHSPSFVSAVTNIWTRGTADLGADDFLSATLIVFDGDTGEITARVTGGPLPTTRTLRAASGTNQLVSGVWYQNNIPNSGHPSGLSIALFAMRSLSIPPGVTAAVVGTRPVALVFGTGVNIEGELTASAGSVDGAQAGPGGFVGGSPSSRNGEPISGTCGGIPPTSTNAYFSGGGGGAFGHFGANGGVGQTLTSGGFGGAPVGDAMMTPLRGGCGGSSGGGRVGGASGGAGGSGGGALAILARHFVELEATGIISANGSGGGGGSRQSNGDSGGAGGGGGSGGAIFIEAPVVRARLTGALGGVFANGGAGGGAGLDLVAGSDGSRGRDDVVAASGGASPVAPGGLGGCCGASNAAQGGRAGAGSGGGGGGAIGRITIRTREALRCVAGPAGAAQVTLSPFAGLESWVSPAPTVCATIP